MPILKWTIVQVHSRRNELKPMLERVTVSILHLLPFKFWAVSSTIALLYQNCYPINLCTLHGSGLVSTLLIQDEIITLATSSNRSSTVVSFNCLLNCLKADIFSVNSERQTVSLLQSTCDERMRECEILGKDLNMIAVYF